MNYEVGYKEYCCISCGFSWQDMLDSQVGECPRCGSKDTFCSENTGSRVGLAYDESTVWQLRKENRRLRAELIKEKHVGMRPAALTAELNKLSPAERYLALQTIESFIIQYDENQKDKDNGNE